MPKPRGKKKPVRCQKANSRAGMELSAVQSKTLSWQMVHLLTKKTCAFRRQPSKPGERLAYKRCKARAKLAWGSRGAGQRRQWASSPPPPPGAGTFLRRTAEALGAAGEPQPSGCRAAAAGRRLWSAEVLLGCWECTGFFQ